MHNNSTKVRLGGDSDDVGNVNMEGNLFYLLLQLLDSWKVLTQADMSLVPKSTSFKVNQEKP